MTMFRKGTLEAVVAQRFCRPGVRRCDFFIDLKEGAIGCVQRNRHLPVVLHQGCCGSARIGGEEGTITDLDQQGRPLGRSRFIPRSR